jgi:hypothetical protein
MNEESIKCVTEKVTSILLMKNADYGNASFDLGLNGNMVHLWDKVCRYRNLIMKYRKNPNYEGLEDTLIDIIGYSIIGLHILKDSDLKVLIDGDVKDQKNGK